VWLREAKPGEAMAFVLQIEEVAGDLLALER
jgi:hypothetical protein